MSQFAKVIRYLSKVYPPSSTEFHNPLQVLDTVQLMQETLPRSELFGVPELFASGNSAGAEAVGEFVSEDATPTGIFGVAFIIWAAMAENNSVATQSLAFALNDESGVIRIEVSLPQTVLAARSVGLPNVPFIVPHKMRLVVRDQAGGTTINLRYARTTVLRGEPLPYF